jgi:dynein heavy chain
LFISHLVIFTFPHQPGGGRNDVDPRFITLFSVFNVTFPSEESLTKIYSSILDGHLQPFSKEIKELTDAVTSSTLQLYTQIVHNHPPTPSKFHYIFNLRDLSRVYQGLCLTVPDRFETANQFIRVWRNECLRVFHDRLTNASDKAAVQVCIPGCYR